LKRLPSRNSTTIGSAARRACSRSELPIEWTNRLPEFYPGMTLTILHGVGHFVPFEAPDNVVDAI
jgi:pimeloyl-ACP methyl ester carboxylesterase